MSVFVCRESIEICVCMQIHSACVYADIMESVDVVSVSVCRECIDICVCV